MKSSNSNHHLAFVVCTLFLSGAIVHAAGTTSGRTLLEVPSARPAALGEAFTAVTNDISAFSYNPASLKSLETAHASFLYQKGLAEDSYGHFMIGSPLQAGALGFSLGYYNGGDMELTDASNNTRTVKAKTDLTGSLGYAREMGLVSVGITGKYISSELIETKTATAFAGDLGLQMPVGERMHMGAAIQNIGSKLKYVNESSDLPQIARIGMSYGLFQNSYKTTLLLDAPYYMKDKELRAGVGIETLVGPLALRIGYRSGSELSALSFGAGFGLGRMTLDYSYGLVNDLDATHRVSMGLRFGGSSSQSTVSKAPEPEVKFVQRLSLTEQKTGQAMTRNGEVYLVRKGDTLGKIANKMYGDPTMWKKIYAANQHLLSGSKNLETGQQLVLP